MALCRTASSVIPTIAYQVARASPVVLGHVTRLNNCTLPTVQKRTFILGTIINVSFDLVALTTGCAAMRRVSGVDVRRYAQNIQDEAWRGYVYRYLDFGEMCADKIVQFFRKNVSEKEKREYEEYIRHCEECREYEHKHQNQHDRVEKH